MPLNASELMQLRLADPWDQQDEEGRSQVKDGLLLDGINWSSEVERMRHRYFGNTDTSIHDIQMEHGIDDMDDDEGDDGESIGDEDDADPKKSRRRTFRQQARRVHMAMAISHTTQSKARRSSQTLIDKLNDQKLKPEEYDEREFKRQQRATDDQHIDHCLAIVRTRSDLRTPLEQRTLSSWIRSHHSSLLNELDQEGLMRVCDRIRYAQMPNQHIVCRQGDPSDSLYIIIRGCVSIWVAEAPAAQSAAPSPVTSPSYRPRRATGTHQKQEEKAGEEVVEVGKTLMDPTLQQVVPTESSTSSSKFPYPIPHGCGHVKFIGALAAGGTRCTFGELGLVSGQPRSATVKCEQLTQCLVIEKQDFDAVVREHSEALKEKVDAIRKFECFSELNERALQRLSFFFRKMTFQSRKVVFHSGDVCDYVYFLVSGDCQIVHNLVNTTNKTETDTVPIPLAVIGPYTVFGEEAAFSPDQQARHSYGIRTLTPCDVFAIRRLDFLRRIERTILARYRVRTRDKIHFREIRLKEACTEMNTNVHHMYYTKHRNDSPRRPPRTDSSAQLLEWRRRVADDHTHARVAPHLLHDTTGMTTSERVAHERELRLMEKQRQDRLPYVRKEKHYEKQHELAKQAQKQVQQGVSQLYQRLLQSENPKLEIDATNAHSPRFPALPISPRPPPTTFSPSMSTSSSTASLPPPLVPIAALASPRREMIHSTSSVSLSPRTKGPSPKVSPIAKPVATTTSASLPTDITAYAPYRSPKNAHQKPQSQSQPHPQSQPVESSTSHQRDSLHVRASTANPSQISLDDTASSSMSTSSSTSLLTPPLTTRTSLYTYQPSSVLQQARLHQSLHRSPPRRQPHTVTSSNALNPVLHVASSPRSPRDRDRDR